MADLIKNMYLYMYFILLDLIHNIKNDGIQMSDANDYVKKGHLNIRAAQELWSPVALLNYVKTPTPCTVLWG